MRIVQERKQGGFRHQYARISYSPVQPVWMRWTGFEPPNRAFSSYSHKRRNVNVTFTRLHPALHKNRYHITNKNSKNNKKVLPENNNEVMTISYNMLT
jgi:hypothetical protein